MPKETEVSHRNHIFRTLIQKPLEKHTSNIIHRLNRTGLLENTQIEKVIAKTDPVLPDHVTLAGLEMTVDTARSFAAGWVNGNSIKRGLVGWGLDGLDGNLARELGMVSPEGAVKDVLADRIADIYTASLVAKERGLYEICPDNLKQNLAIAFQLSTLTKAACEMCNVHTREAGLGSMLQRRPLVMLLLIDLGTLYKGTTISKQRTLLHRIDGNIQFLIDGSFKSAKKRTRAIASAQLQKDSGWNNPNVTDEHSPAAVEARKYAAVFALNERMGFSIIETLNTLTDGVVFPSADSLRETYPYVDDCIRKTNDFLTHALSIAGLSKFNV